LTVFPSKYASASSDASADASYIHCSAAIAAARRAGCTGKNLHFRRPSADHDRAFAAGTRDAAAAQR